MLMLLLFLPGTWICYGLCRFGLSYLSIPANDQIVMSFLAALVYLLCAMLRTWELWNRTSSTPQAETPKS